MPCSIDWGISFWLSVIFIRDFPAYINQSSCLKAAHLFFLIGIWWIYWFLACLDFQLFFQFLDSWHLLCQFLRQGFPQFIIGNANEGTNAFQWLFDDHLIGCFAEQYANGGMVLFAFDLFVNAVDVEIQLSSKFRLEIANLQFKYHKAVQMKTGLLIPLLE